MIGHSSLTNPKCFYARLSCRRQIPQSTRQDPRRRTAQSKPDGCCLDNLEVGTCERKHVGYQDLVLVCSDIFYFVSIHSRDGSLSLPNTISIPSGGITTFGPLIINSFGFDSFKTILLNMPFGAVQIISTMGGAWLATRWKKKGPVLAMLCIPPIVGIVMLLTISHTPGHRGPLLVGYYLVSHHSEEGLMILLTRILGFRIPWYLYVYSCSHPKIITDRFKAPLIYSWSSQNTAGETKKKTTTAMLFIGQSAGNV